MIVRSSKFLLLFVAATFLGTAVLAAVAAWQLSRGPISLSFLTPYVEESLSGGADGVQVRLHDTVLTWAGLERTLDVRAVGLEILDKNGKVGAVVPEMSVQFSLRALLRGIVAPTGLDLFGPRLHVVRETDGKVLMGFGALSADETAAGDIELVAGLLREPDPDSPTGYLRRVSVVSALIEFEDRQTDRNWTAQRADLALERDANGIRADGIIVLDAGGDVARFEVSGLLNAATKAIELGLSFDDLSPVVIASLDPRLGELDRVKLPVTGTLALSLSSTLAVEDVNFDLTGGAGEIAVPEYYPAPLPVTRLALRGRAAEGLSHLVIDEATADLGGPLARLRGDIVRRDGAVEVQLETSAEKLPVNTLENLWPPDVAINARKWITRNIRDGVVDAARLKLAAAARLDGADNSFDVRSASGEIVLHGATVHYLRPLPPARNVRGVGHFDGDSLVFDVSESNVGDLKIEVAKVAIHGFTGPAPVETVRVDLTVAGPARDALVLLDGDPLNFISPFGIDPARTSGRQTTNAVIEFPLLDALTVDKVEVAAASRLEDFSSPAVAFGADLTGGNFTLEVDKQQLVATGAGALASIPVKLTWTERFPDEAAVSTRYEVQAVLDDGARETLGLAAAPYVSGPVGVGLTYEVAPDGGARGAADLNLADATLSLADLGWRKAPGQAGTARVEFAGRQGAIGEISKFAVQAPGLTANGSATLAKDGDGLAVSELDLERLVLGETDVALRLTYADDGVPDVVIGGKTLDLRRQVKTAFAEDGNNPPAMRVHIDTANSLRSVRLGEETALQNPTGRLVHDGEKWTAIDLRGNLSNGGKIDLQLQTLNGRREVLFKSDDGGGVLRALDWITTIDGGALQLVGTFTGGGKDEVFAGQLALKDFKLNEGPVMARILSLASFSGIADALAGTGITFRRAEVPFEVTDAEIRIGDAKARGADIGILATGRIDRPTDTIELKGEIAPAYTLNSIFAEIPVLGPLLTGGGDAIFAATYSVKGPIDDPQVSVNPLTVLTPGILRRLISGFGEGEGFQEGSSEPLKRDIPE